MKGFFTRSPGHRELKFFVFILVLLGLGLGLALLLWRFPALSRKLRLPGKCGWETYFGIPCPGCGGTRAVKALVQGRLRLSWHYHAGVPFAAGLMGLFALFYALNRVSKGRIPCLAYRDLYLYLMAGVLLLQWLVKLLYQWQTGTPWLG